MHKPKQEISQNTRVTFSVLITPQMLKAVLMKRETHSENQLELINVLNFKVNKPRIFNIARSQSAVVFFSEWKLKKLQIVLIN